MKKTLFLLLFLAQPAWAWEQYRTLPAGFNGEPLGCGLRWPGPVVRLALDATTLDGLETVDVQAIAEASSQAWQHVQCTLCQTCQNGQEAPQTCAQNPLGMEFLWLARGKPSAIGATCTSQNADGSCDAVSGNGNWVSFIHDEQTWKAQGEVTPVSSLVVALTVLTYDRNSGEIRDADVLLDDATHHFCVAPACAGERYDLQSTLTHECGHVLGLDHSADVESTMFAGADPGESKKRTLESDDTMGVCTAYRTTCNACADPTVHSGCQAGSIGNGWGLLLLLLAGGTIRRARN